MTIIAKNGNKGFITWVTDTFATPLPTKSKVPTSGVQIPMHRFNTITIPKCTGSIPKVVTTGKNIGVNINTAGVMSIKVPTMSRIMLMAKKMANLLSSCSNKNVLIISGIPSKENNQDMAMEVQSCMDARNEIELADYPKIRYFQVANAKASEPLEDVHLVDNGKADWLNKWNVCSPATVGNLTGVGYFFVVRNAVWVVPWIL